MHDRHGQMINRAGHDRVLRASRFVFAEGVKDDRRMAFAVADEAGELVYAARMDATHARVLVHATRKAFTAATMQRDTLEFGRQDKERAKTLADWGDSRLTYMPGGVVLVRGDEYLGGVGVGGGTDVRDHEIALAAARLLFE